ncbi:MAG: hypothetical protein JKX76_04970 [Colwellia sp.]|nr:hypothetical protein [Colwellia sp.]
MTTFDKRKNQQFHDRDGIKNYFLTKTGLKLPEYDRLKLSLKSVKMNFNDQELELMNASLNEPDEHFIVKPISEMGEVGFAIQAHTGKSYVIRSLEQLQREKAAVIEEEKTAVTSKNYSEYMLSEEFVTKELLVALPTEKRVELELLATLIGRAFRGEPVTDNTVKTWQEFMDES